MCVVPCVLRGLSSPAFAETGTAATREEGLFPEILCECETALLNRTSDSNELNLGNAKALNLGCMHGQCQGKGVTGRGRSSEMEAFEANRDEGQAGPPGGLSHGSG